MYPKENRKEMAFQSNRGGRGLKKVMGPPGQADLIHLFNFIS